MDIQFLEPKITTMIQQASMVKTFFESCVTFQDYIEFRIQDRDKDNMFSLYATSWNDIVTICREYSNHKFNIYYGINTRTKRGRKIEDIDYRRMFYFDIEGDTIKPTLEDGIYVSMLHDTAKYIANRMEKEFGAFPVCAFYSGRGMHLVYRIDPIECKTTNIAFKKWYKDVQERFDIDKPHKYIKFKDNVFDSARIESCPGTIHTKYEEKPRRNIIYLDEKRRFDVMPFLKPFFDAQIKYHQIQQNRQIKKRYDSKTIFKSPEMMLLSNFNDLPEGTLHTKIIYALKLLMKRDNVQNFDEVREHLHDLGYVNKEINHPQEGEYTERVLIRWCLDNAGWCLKHKYKLPYKLPEWKNRELARDLQLNIKEDFSHISLRTYGELRQFIYSFNNKYGRYDCDTFYYPATQLEIILMKITDKDLYDYLCYIKAFPPLFGLHGVIGINEQQQGTKDI